MKLLLYSDLHAHPFKPYATVLPNGMNSRLADTISCVQQILDYCIHHPEIEAVLFGGDLFHTRGRLSVQAFNAIFETIAGFQVRKIPQLLIDGNHDQADRHGSVVSIHTLRTVATVVDAPGWQHLQTRTGKFVAVMAVPYTENVQHLRELVNEPMPFSNGSPVPKIFLGHLGIQGAKVGADYVYPGPYDPAIADLNTSAFDYAFLGHFHLHQQLAPNACYIGAPLQHNWGDKNDPNRGFLVYDTDTRTVERVALRSPHFVEVEWDLLKIPSAQQGFQHYATDGFLQVIDRRVWSEDEKEDLRIKLGARDLQVVQPADAQPQVSNRRVTITPGMGYSEILQSCIDSGVLPMEEGLDPDYLVMLGAEIFSEVEDGQ